MTSIDSELVGILEHQYRPSKEDGRFIWLIQVAPDGKPYGAGELFDDSLQVATRIRWAAGKGGAIHLCNTALTGYTDDTHRAELTADYTASVVLDIDQKDQDCDPSQLFDRINNVQPIPSIIANSANGFHVYYQFNMNVVGELKSIHRTLQAHYKSKGVIVDPAHSATKSTIRALCSLGKNGIMRVGDTGVCSGPVYDIESFAFALGVNGFQIEIEGEVHNDSEMMFSLRPQVNRNQLFHTCAATNQFFVDSASGFESGSVSSYHDARMFASQMAHSYNPELDDPTDVTDRRDFTVGVLTQYPQHDPEHAATMFEGTLKTPAMRCDKWHSERYKSMCEVCKYREYLADNSPVANAINDEAIGEYANKEELDPNASANASTTPGVLQTPAINVTNPAPTETIPGNPRLPEGYSIGKNGTVFRYIEPEAGAVDDSGEPLQPTYRPVCKPAFTLMQCNIRMIRNSSKDPYIDGWEGMVFGSEAPLNIGAQALNNPNELKKDISPTGIKLLSQNEAHKYFWELVDLAPDRKFVERLGYKDKSHDEFIMLGTHLTDKTVEHVEMRGPLKTNYIDGEKGIENVRPCGDITAWRDVCLTPFIKNAELSSHMLLILSAFAAPLYAITGHESGPVLNFYGDSSTGKTTALNIANSVYGPPTTHTLTPRDTQVSMFLKMGMVKNLPVTLDESTTLDPKVLFDLAYISSGGRDKSRGNQDGGLQAQTDWNTCVLATSNYPARALVSALAANNDAVYNRLIDFCMESEVITEDNKQIMQAAQITANNNFGLVGQLFIQEVLRQRSYILTAYANHMAQTNYNKAGRFIERHFTLIEIAVSILGKLNLIDPADMTHISDTLKEVAELSSSGKQQLITDAMPSLVDLRLYCQQRAVPMDPVRYKDEYLANVVAGTVQPDRKEVCYEDSGIYFMTKDFFRYYALINHPTFSMSVVKDLINKQLKPQGQQLDCGARLYVPTVNGRYINSSATVITKRTRLLQIPQ